MRTKSTIIGVGEAMLAEIAGQNSPAGLAPDAALAAHRLGQTGIAISRLGQDLAANELLTQLIAAELDVTHFQSDPDLPTGRLVVRTIAGATRRTLQPRAAFDNLQWDFDLVDVAQRADAVLFGMLAQRGGQTQSVIARFLSECEPALRVFDLTNRDDERFDRRRAFASIERADVVVIDYAGWRQLSLAGAPGTRDDVVAALTRPLDLALVLHVEHGERAALHAANASHRSLWTYASDTHAAVVAGLIHGLLSQRDAETCLRLMGMAAAHAKTNPQEKMPNGWDA